MAMPTTDQREINSSSLMVAPDPSTYEFGSYRIVAHQGLYHRGEYVALAPKEFAVLYALASRLGNVVTKDQLVAEVWPRDFVSDESIARCMYVLRRTLEQPTDGKSRGYIQTVHRRGYRLAVPVRKLDAAQHALPAPTVQQQQALDHCQLGFGRLGFCSWGDTEQAILCFQKALELDSSCALAYAGMGEATIIQAGHGWINVGDAREMLRGMAEAGRIFEPQSGAVYALSAMVASMFEWDWPRAEAEAQRAAELGGGYQASLAIGNAALCQGRAAEAVPHFEAAVRAAPYVPHCHDMLIWGLLALEDYARALVQARRASEMLPSIAAIQQSYSVAASYSDLHDEAIAAAEKATQLSARESHSLSILATALYRADRQDEACNLHAEILSQAARQRIVWSSLAPEVLLIEGVDRCLEVLELALQDRCCILAIKCTDPRFRPLLKEPRFQAILKAIYGGVV